MIRKLIPLFTLLICSSLMAQHNGPDYKTDETREVILKMIEAHGGIAKWKQAKTISFDNIMFNNLPNAGSNPWWVDRNVIDQKTRRVYQDWPIHESEMAYDGKETWAINWKVGNPPKFQVHFFYYFLNLPWLTQDDNIRLGEVNKTSVEGYPNELLTISMEFNKKPTVGKTINDSYKLYIDSKTYLLAGYEYSIGYGHMLDLMGLPKDKNVMGPMFRIHDSFTEVDGLIFPNRFHTMNTTMTSTYGYHIILNYYLLYLVFFYIYDFFLYI